MIVPILYLVIAFLFYWKVVQRTEEIPALVAANERLKRRIESLERLGEQLSLDTINHSKAIEALERDVASAHSNFAEGFIATTKTANEDREAFGLRIAAFEIGNDPHYGRVMDSAKPPPPPPPPVKRSPHTI